MEKSRVQDYYLIGNLHTTALVSNRGAIDWLCWPRFDSGSVFAEYVEQQNGGTFSVASEGYQCFSEYVTNTPIVETFYAKGNVAFRIRDFMLPLPTKRPHAQYLTRKIFGDAGNTEIVFRFSPRPSDKASSSLTIVKRGQTLQLAYSQGILRLFLPKDAKVERSDGVAIIRVPIKSGETKQLVLEFMKSGVSTYRREDFEEQAITFWKPWVNSLNIAPFCRAELIRSAIVLKLLQYYPTGAMVSVPTTCHTETNNDCRNVSMRDIGRTLYALHQLGCNEEVEKLFYFIEGVVDRDISVGLSGNYAIDGKNFSEKSNLNNSKISKLQMGGISVNKNQTVLSGSILATYQYVISNDLVVSTRAKSLVIRLVEAIGRDWRERDLGVWQLGQKPQHFTYSKMMAWLGVNKALQIADELNVSEVRLQQWRILEREIRQWILTYCYDSVRKTLVQHPATTMQEATNFLYPIFNFFETGDDRSQSVVRVTARELVSSEVYVRKSKLDGSRTEDIGSLAYTYWYIESMARIGEVKEALRQFNEVGRIRPSHGLLSENIQIENKDFLGNYPSLISHIAFVAAAYELHRNWQTKYGAVLSDVDERIVLE